MQVLGVVVGCVCFGAITFALCKELYKEIYLPRLYERDLEAKVKWIATKTYSGRTEELVEYIEEEQYKLNIDKKYVVDFASEKEEVREILEAHRQSVADSFFRDSLRKDKALYNLNSLEYYMLSLCCFLERHSTDKSSGVTYYKLYYIVSRFCVNNENVKPLFPNHIATFNTIKKFLEKE